MALSRQDGVTVIETMIALSLAAVVLGVTAGDVQAPGDAREILP